jgi:hypothetical protein
VNLLIALAASSFVDGPGRRDRGLLLFPWLLYSIPVQPLYICVHFASVDLEVRYLIPVFKNENSLSLLKQIIYFIFYEQFSVA